MENKQKSAPFCRACQAALDPAQSRGHKNGYDLLPCNVCGTVTVHPFPSLEELNRFYQSYKGSAVYKPKEKQKIRRATRRIKRLSRYTSGQKVLDVGCNCGYTVKAALDLGKDGHGIDIDAAAVATANKNYGPHFDALSVQDYAALGKKADIIYSSEVIEHVPDPDGFVRALAQVLEKDGVLFLTTPDAGHWRVPKNFAAWRAVTPPSHIVYFTRKGLKRLLEKYGFEVVKFHFALKAGIQVIARKAAQAGS